ncbi:MAG: LamG-like jellyroll fold domain-containing protein, partial [Dehalococcoidia bacterium]
TIYVDGELVDVTTVSAPTGIADSEAGENLFIGNRSADDFTFDGHIDEPALHGSVLTAAQVRAHFLARSEPDPELQRKLEEVDRNWSHELEIINAQWSQDLESLHQERHDLEVYWGQELAMAEESWSQELAKIVQYLNHQEDNWANELNEIDLRLAVIVGPSREAGLLKRKRSLLVSQFESERLQIEQDFEIRQQQIEKERFLLQQEMDQQLGFLDQQIADKESWWLEAQQELEWEWSQVRERAEQEWVNRRDAQHDTHSEVVATSDAPLLKVEPEQKTADPVSTAASPKVVLEAPVLAETFPNPEPKAEPAPESVELTVKESQAERRQRGFFINRETGLSGSSFEQALEPTTLAVLGILITLATATLSLVRGR